MSLGNPVLDHNKTDYGDYDQIFSSYNNTRYKSRLDF